MYNLKFKTIFIAIIILSSILRFWSLNNFPTGFNADEASIGYNAYSLIQTGKDEYGTSWPLVFKSFGDFKPGLYVYISMPFVATLGLNEWAVRLPSALFGIGTVVLIYFLTKEIFKDKKIALVSSLLLAISPWHIHFSRGGWETNVATFFITFGVLLFIKGLEKPKLFIWSAVTFLASMYIYQSPRVVVPVLIIALVFLYRKNLFTVVKTIELKKKLINVALLIFLVVPLILQFASGQGGARFKGLSFLGDTGPTSRINELRGEHQDINSMWVKILHNKLTAYGSAFLGHYLDHFKPDFLFINGDPIIRNKVPETGQFYLIESLFLLVGLVSLIRINSAHKKLLFAWVLIAPLASSLTFQTPHALRALNMIIPLTMIMAYGLGNIVSGIKSKWRFAGISIICLVILFELVHYLESYYIHYPKRYPLAWEYGFSQMVLKLQKLEGNYDKIVITDRYDQPYVLVLFYEKYDPRRYQPQAKLTERDKFNFGTVRSFDKFEFRPVDPNEIGKTERTLFIGTENEIPKDVKIIDKVDFSNGKPAFLFVGT